MATLTELRALVARVANLSNTSDEQALIDTWLNEGYRQAVMRLDCNVEAFSASLTAGTDDYAIGTAPFDAAVHTRRLKWLRAWASGSQSNVPLKLVDAGRILDRRKGIQSPATGTPREVAFLGQNRLMVWPTPEGSVTIEGYQVSRPTAMSSGSDTPSVLPEEHHLSVVAEWALKRAFEYRSQYDRADIHARNFENGLLDALALQQSAGGDVPAPIYDLPNRRVKYPDEF